MKLLYTLLVLLAASIMACATVESKTTPKREGNEVKCALISNGPANEVCVYPAGVLCFGGDKGLSCIQPLPMSGGPG